MKCIKEIIKTWWTKHICADFPEYYPPECFNCNLSNKECKNCKYKGGING